MTKPKLYILCGLPYSGKTTLANELAKKLNIEIVSTDDIIDKHGFETELMTQEQWDLVFDEAYIKIKEMLVNGMSVILDLANLLKSERDSAKQLAESAGADSVLIYISIPVEEIQNRWLDNEKTLVRDQLSKKELHKAIDMFEEPTSDEDFVEYKSEGDLDKITNQ